MCEIRKIEIHSMGNEQKISRQAILNAASDRYRGFIQGKQMVMIGYSDSAKDAGVMAASWSAVPGTGCVNQNL